MEDRDKIDKLFRKHCKKCDTHCCCNKKELTVFKFELNNINKIGWESFSFIRQGRRNNQRNNQRKSSIKRIKLKNQCPFFDKNGCIFNPIHRPIDCLSYPVYPVIQYKKGNALIKYMAVHKSCSNCRGISKDLQLIKVIYNFWNEIIKQIQIKDLKEWFGDKKNYWLNKNLIKVKVLW